MVKLIDVSGAGCMNSNVYDGAPSTNSMLCTVAPTLATKRTSVRTELPNCAVLVGTWAGSQLAAEVQCDEAGLSAQLEFPVVADVDGAALV